MKMLLLPFLAVIGLKGSEDFLEQKSLSYSYIGNSIVI